jgi:orotidine-5'-phosphate decarboxylase
MNNQVLIALDYHEQAQAIRMAHDLRDTVGGFKVGLELIMAEGPQVISAVAALGLPVFADAKLHDIPTTVRRAASALAKAGARWITVHAAGGSEMLNAAVVGAEAGSDGRPVGVLAVTVLTSLDQADLTETGVRDTVFQQVARLAKLAALHGAEGVVCSPHEVSAVKAVAPDLIAVTPGIRLDPESSHDQRRIASPGAAIALGADLLVVGRAVTGAIDPIAAVQSVLMSIEKDSQG